MFTGIIEALGTITAINVTAEGARLSVVSESLDMADVQLGDSIATNGVCLTVVEFDHNSYRADVSNESLQRTNFGRYQTGQVVNLEKAMLPTTRFGGHMVSGHVDAVTEICAIERDGNSIQYWVNMPESLARYIAEKGSVTIDGISLTVNSVTQDKFRLTVVPHTAAQTIMKDYSVGTKVHIEVDLIARYIERLLNVKDESPSSSVTHELLARSGFIK